MCQWVDHIDSLLEASVEQRPLGLILRAEGDVFCSGADLSLVKEVVNTPERGMEMQCMMRATFDSLRQSDIVSVASIQGPAVGGGSEVVTVPDFRVMLDPVPTSESKKGLAVFIQFLHAKLGTSPGWGGATRLCEILRRQDALRLLATSERVSPSEALRIGLVDRVVTSEVDEAAMDLLNPFLAMEHVGSVRAVKRIVGCDAINRRGVESTMFGQRWPP